MANQLDELTGNVNSEGRDVNVIEKQIAPKIGFGSLLFEIFISTVGFVPAVIMTFGSGVIMDQTTLIIAWIAGFLPAIIYFIMKINAQNYFRKLQQKIQANASEIDNYLEQRVMILQNIVPLIAKAIDLDKDTMKTVAAFRGGAIADENRNIASAQIDNTFARLFPQVEAYPELKAHETIAEAMRQNSYLQKEITAARTLYNDTVNMWNMDIFVWPVKKIVAARAGYTSRIPFTASSETKARAREVFF